MIAVGVGVVLTRGDQGGGPDGPSPRTLALLLPPAGPEADAALQGTRLALDRLGEGWGLMEIAGVNDSAEATRVLSELEPSSVTCVLDASTPGSLTLACASSIRDELVVASVTQTDPNLVGPLGGSYLQLTPSASPLGDELAALAKQAGVQRPVLVSASRAGAEAAAAFRARWGLSDRLVFPLESAAQVPWLFEQLEPLRPDALVLFTDAELAGKIAASPAAGELRLLGGPALFEPAFASAAVGKLERVLALRPPTGAAVPSDPEFEQAWGKAHEGPAPDLARLAYDAARLLITASDQVEGAEQRVNRVAGLARGVQWVGASGPLELGPDGARQRPAWEPRTFTADGVQVPWRPR
ncbi:MAG: hypothetical protein KDD82_28250 [Planctomycetes bacterium]|nr:hypothetical protein [Planctomycetota bacterium]